MPKKTIYWPLLLSLASLKLIFHLLFIDRYGFHRDEFLYLALGRHPDFGYWSNPPFIGWLSWLVQHTLGGSIWATRLPAVLAGCALLVLTGLLARELGGGRYAQFLAGFGGLVAPFYLRAGHMFQPVIFDIFFWTAMIYLLVRYINTERDRYLLLFGALLALGFLNKYTVIFLLAALLPALLLTPLRKALLRPATLKAAGLALLIVLPNLIWQYTHKFPVVTHMSELARNQLGNVRPQDFLLDQLFMSGSALLLWLPGIAWLLLAKPAQPYRSTGYLYLFVLFLFIALSGKSYYTLGMYPLLIAAGAVAWAQWSRLPLPRIVLPAAMALLLLPVLPLGVPVLPLDRLLGYCQTLIRGYHFDGPMRWEDGRIHPLPQDYADMLGWERLAQLAEEAHRRSGEPVILYGENYGQAGAIDHLGQGLPPAASFSDSYRLWAPDTVSTQALIYVNDELGPDIDSLFGDITLIGQIDTPNAREFGTQVYLCRKPSRQFGPFLAEKIRMVKSSFR